MSPRIAQIDDGARIYSGSLSLKFLDLGEKAYLLPEKKKLLEKAQLTVARR
jgi:hypothetical protein